MDATLSWMLGVMGIMVAYAVCAFVGYSRNKG